MYWTSTEAHVYMRRHQGAKVEHFDVSNVIITNFHTAPFPIHSMGENVNVMLEFIIITFYTLKLPVKGTRRLFFVP